MTTDEKAMCLLHHDFHAMTQDCWRVTVDWYTRHQNMPEDQQRNAYQAAVEHGMLHDLRSA